MSPVLRIWLGFAALGAALIHLAVGVTAPLPLSVLLVGFGIAELGWGIATLAAGRVIAPRVVVGAALIPVFIWGSTAALGSGLGVTSAQTGLPLYPMAVSSLFNIFLAATVAIALRRASHGIPTPVGAAGAGELRAATPGGWRFLTGLVVGGFLLSALTTPALAATEVGSHAVPHGSHGVTQVTEPDPGSHGAH
ncbi:hypothetical protein E3O25_10730 [Cryobacterium sp. TMT1-3]|uniref:Uncharacterized protein n=1 Tax=Cryobacterium luteum TaxID=1424661 RepID=A0A1H8HRW4_9MICO|nr:MULTISPECIES: hypothetical protein [Cryobacterium]TFB94175.1 hypothetical protein E3O10_01625 [Cryobacterium luteum]TFC26867.1 hypothetical protein E3O25_10730 [Cryobacterium sp. TMT1-3]SEN58787.1 hypothetical protein SAMN05216281_11023 [Cryobacterium luteum]